MEKQLTHGLKYRLYIHEGTRLDIAEDHNFLVRCIPYKRQPDRNSDIFERGAADDGNRIINADNK